MKWLFDVGPLIVALSRRIVNTAEVILDGFRS